MIALLFVVLFVLLLLGIPIGISIGIAAMTVIAAEGIVPLLIVPQKMLVAMNTWTLLALPFFMLVGVIMDKSGITDRLVYFANSLVGWLRSGMSYVSVFTGMLMGGISGSAPADTAALSGVMIPSMRRLGYPGAYAAALQAASGAIGIIIPPSIPMVVLGSVTNISVGGLFMGGLIPGILIGLSLMGISAIICRKRGYGEKTTTAFSFKAAWRSTKDAFLPLMAPIIIVGGILTGVFTPTESGGIAAVYTLFLGMAIYRKISLKDLPGIFLEATVSAANVVLIIAASALFSWFLTKNGVPHAISSFLLSISDSQWFILFAVNLIFFIGGMFLEGLALIIMFVPILLPVAMQVGINPIFFGVMVVINIAIGTLTPPVGVCLFVASSSGNESFEEVTARAMPFVGALTAVLILCCILPEIITFLPTKVFP